MPRLSQSKKVFSRPSNPPELLGETNCTHDWAGLGGGLACVRCASVWSLCLFLSGLAYTEVVWMLFHVCIPPSVVPPSPRRACQLLIRERAGGRGWGEGHKILTMSKTGFQHCPLMVLKGGARFTCSRSQGPRDVLVGFYLGSFALSLFISAFRSGSGDQGGRGVSI